MEHGDLRRRSLFLYGPPSIKFNRRREMKFINSLAYMFVGLAFSTVLVNASAHAYAGTEIANSPEMNPRELQLATDEWEVILEMIDAGSDQVAGPGGRGSSCSLSGMASYYGPGFHGRRTASGQTFNANGLTAAHRSLGFGQQVRVTSHTSGRSVTVRINDRGPFHGGRIIDLSAGAARVIGISTGRVHLQCI